MRTTDGPDEPAGRGDDVGHADPEDDLLEEYVPMGSAALTDTERWPALPAADLARVAAARTHPNAPVWMHATGDRLDEADLAALTGRAPVAGSAGTLADPDVPDWVAALVERAHATVPRYRRLARAGRTGPTSPLTALPTVTRRDLVTDLTAHVPVDVPLDRVLEGTSSGRTGASLRVPLHPVSIAADLLLVHALVTAAGASWEVDPERLALANLVDQRVAFTYVSAMSAFPRPAGTAAPLMARVNLDPSAWRRPGDRERWFAEHRPQVVSTSALPLLHLLDLADAGLSIHPLAVVNGATHITPAVRARVRAAWDAPVVDLYGLRETGPVAAQIDGDPGHVLVDRRVHVEILAPDGSSVPDGTRGEIVVTADENPYLPLLRYRTGDHASLVRGDDGRPVLLGLEGREPVRFRDAAGRWRPSIDATQVLQASGLLAWHLHQDAEGGLRLVAVSPDRLGAERAARAVRDWLGLDVELEALTDPAGLGPGKPLRYTTAMDPQHSETPQGES
jgi:phenylacetate-CoA ligase